MMYLHTAPDGTQVLSFDSTEEARSVGEHLAAMGDGLRFYCRGEGATPDQLRAAYEGAKKANPLCALDVSAPGCKTVAN